MHALTLTQHARTLVKNFIFGGTNGYWSSTAQEGKFRNVCATLHASHPMRYMLAVARTENNVNVVVAAFVGRVRGACGGEECVYSEPTRFVGCNTCTETTTAKQRAPRMQPTMRCIVSSPTSKVTPDATSRSISRISFCRQAREAPQGDERMAHWARIARSHSQVQMKTKQIDVTDQTQNFTCTRFKSMGIASLANCSVRLAAERDVTDAPPTPELISKCSIKENKQSTNSETACMESAASADNSWPLLHAEAIGWAPQLSVRLS